VCSSDLIHPQDDALALFAHCCSREHLDTLHVLGHGAPGEVILGSQKLDEAALVSIQERLVSMKAVAIQGIAKERGFVLADCFGYSDSHNDLPLLQTVGHPSAINPDAKLRIRALKENWPIHDFRRMRSVNRWLGPIVSRAAWLGTRLTPRRKSK
jgi:hypothetical protein